MEVTNAQRASGIAPTRNGLNALRSRHGTKVLHGKLRVRALRIVELVAHRHRADSAGALLFRKECVSLPHRPTSGLERGEPIEALLVHEAGRAELRPECLGLLRHEGREQHSLSRKLAYE